MIAGRRHEGPGLSVRSETPGDGLKRLYSKARVGWLRRGFRAGAECEARAGGSVLAVDGGISQKLNHIGSHQENVRVAALDDVVVFAALIEGEFETAGPVHQTENLIGTLFVPFLDIL
jgi:hypothetical protein